MMKFAFVFLAIVGLSCGKPTPRDLNDDLQDFLKLIPVQEIENIALDYYANDAEVQEVYKYLQSDEFESIVVAVDALQEFKDFVKFLEDKGLDVVSFINQVHDALGIPTILPPTLRKQARRGVGVKGMLDDILAVLPLDQIKALAEDKLQSSPDYKELHDAILSPEFQSIVEALRAMPEYQNFKKDLADKGVDVDQLTALVKDTFGLNDRASRSLNDDLQDFLKLIPVQEIENIALDYYANDAEVQEVVVYLQSDEFEKIVVTVDALPEFKNFIKFLEDKGLDVVSFINQVHELLGIPTILPPTLRKLARRGVGVKGLVDDVIAILPLDDLKALAAEKLQTSPDYKELHDAIQSPEFQTIVQTLRDMPEYQEFKKDLADKGVDIDQLVTLVDDIFQL